MRPRFSLRFLLGTTLIIALGFGFAYQRYTNPNLERLVDELNSYDVSVHLTDFGFPNERGWVVEELEIKHLGEPPFLICDGFTFETVDSSRPLFLVSRLRSVKSLSVRDHDPEVTLKHCDFSHLESLELSGLTQSQLGDWLATANQLRHLRLSSFDEMTFGVGEPVTKCQSLTHLTLADAALSCDDLKKFGELPLLQELAFIDCALADGALEELPTYPALVSLRLSGDQYDDQALEALAKMDQLRTLELDCTQVTDRGVAMIADSIPLRGLGLAGCGQLTKACVPDLEKMRWLDWLNVHNTAVSRYFPSDVTTHYIE